MKYTCRWCHQEIEISQSDKAKTGLKKVQDHEAECFKTRHPTFGRIVNTAQERTFEPEVPDKFDMHGIIKYLHESLGRMPTESEVLLLMTWFRMLLNQSKPTKTECADFVKLLKRLG